MAAVNADNPAFQAPHSNWVVQKFGGTSVGKFALKIIEQVVQYDPQFDCPMNPIGIRLTILLVPPDQALPNNELPSSALPGVVPRKLKAPPIGESSQPSAPNTDNTTRFACP